MVDTTVAGGHRPAIGRTGEVRELAQEISWRAEYVGQLAQMIQTEAADPKIGALAEGIMTISALIEARAEALEARHG